MSVWKKGLLFMRGTIHLLSYFPLFYHTHWSPQTQIEMKPVETSGQTSMRLPGEVSQGCSAHFHDRLLLLIWAELQCSPAQMGKVRQVLESGRSHSSQCIWRSERLCCGVGLGLGNWGPSELELAALGTFQEGCCKWLVTICDPELLSIMGF